MGKGQSRAATASQRGKAQKQLAEEGEVKMMQSLAVNEYVAAEMLCVGVQSLRNYRCLRKGPPYVKMGRSVRYLVSDLEAYLTVNRIDPNVADIQSGKNA